MFGTTYKYGCNVICGLGFVVFLVSLHFQPMTSRKGLLQKPCYPNYSVILHRDQRPRMRP